MHICMYARMHADTLQLISHHISFFFLFSFLKKKKLDEIIFLKKFKILITLFPFKKLLQENCDI
jgi:hypothetical protein